jgi:hypothetical protein
MREAAMADRKSSVPPRAYYGGFDLIGYADYVIEEFLAWAARWGVMEWRADGAPFGSWVLSVIEDEGVPEDVYDELVETIDRFSEELDLPALFRKWRLDEEEIADYLLMVLEGVYADIDPTQPQWGRMPDHVLMWLETEVPRWGEPPITMAWLHALAREWKEL